MMEYMKLNPVLGEVGQELAKARMTHSPMNSHHEGYAVILEESGRTVGGMASPTRTAQIGTPTRTVTTAHKRD